MERFFDGVVRAPRWVALWAAMAGYMLDAMDVLLYVFALQTIRGEFGLTNAQAGLGVSVAMVFSAIGGIAAGMLSDRIGRRDTLIWTILTYSVGTAGAALSRGLPDLLAWRALAGLGLGGQWSAGATLVSESWPAEHRGKAISFMQSGWAIGYMAAAGLSALVLPRFGWRALFALGLLPALVTVLVRRNVREPEVWLRTRGAGGGLAAIFRPPYLRRTTLATALTTAVLFAYWGLFSWAPGFLSAPVSAGGAGLSLVKTGGFVLLTQAGAFAGYLCFGVLSDRMGRRPAFALYTGLAALLTPFYGWLPRLAGAHAETALIALGPLLGFFGTGYFSLFGAMLAEIYPTRIRGVGQGFTYNFGRGLSALAPFLVGAAGDRAGLGAALGINAAFFAAGALLVFLLPETRAARLEEVE
jgi:MFS family permease